MSKFEEVKSDSLSPLENSMPVSDLSNSKLPHLKRRMSIHEQASKLDFSSAGEFSGLSQGEILKISKTIDDSYIQAIHQQDDQQEFRLSDVLEYLSNGMGVIVEDDFSLCFKKAEMRPWNWNFYLFILWVLGVILRYVILFPLRVLIKLIGTLFCLGLLWLWGKLFQNNPYAKQEYELWTIQMLAKIYVFAWTGVVRYHGIIPKKKANQIFVANHTTMLDYVLLLQMNPFCVVGQLHTAPLIAWFQQDLLKSLNCIWFDRKEQKDRDLATQRITDHISDPNNSRLLIFPEGTCVNNKYVIQFKKGTFALNAEICPIAIKYDKTFVDAYWISRERPFHWHLFDVMTSWAMVVDVWYLEPQKIRENESAEDFANRVKKMIADKAGLIDVDWNGYLKHYKPSDRIIEEKKKVFADRLKRLVNYKNNDRIKRLRENLDNNNNNNNTNNENSNISNHIISENNNDNNDSNSNNNLKKRRGSQGQQP